MDKYACIIALFGGEYNSSGINKKCAALFDLYPRILFGIEVSLSIIFNMAAI
jgi:hypothetical protein